MSLTNTNALDLTPPARKPYAFSHKVNLQVTFLFVEIRHVGNRALSPCKVTHRFPMVTKGIYMCLRCVCRSFGQIIERLKFLLHITAISSSQSQEPHIASGRIIYVWSNVHDKPTDTANHVAAGGVAALKTLTSLHLKPPAATQKRPIISTKSLTATQSVPSTIRSSSQQKRRTWPMISSLSASPSASKPRHSLSLCSTAERWSMTSWQAFQSGHLVTAVLHGHGSCPHGER